MTRTRNFLVIAALAGMAAVFAACGGGGGESEENPKKVLEGATLQGIESADLDLALGIDVSGKESGNVKVDVSGPFQSRGKSQLPELAMSAEAKGSVGGSDVNFEGGLTLVPNKAYVSYEGEDYEVDSTTYSFVQSAIEDAQRKSGAESGTKGASECQREAAGKFEVSDFVDNLTNEGSADVGGTQTTKVSGDLDVAGALEALVQLSQLPACSSQLKAAGPLPLGQLSEAKGEIEKAVRSAHAEVYVGEDDIIRRLAGSFEIQPKGSGEKVSIDFDLTLEGVNEDQEITTPDNAKPLNDLFQKLGINPIELLQGVQGGAGIGGLLEGLGSSGNELPGLGSAGGGGAGGGAQGAYLECVQEASTPADIQNCAKKLQ